MSLHSMPSTLPTARWLDARDTLVLMRVEDHIRLPFAAAVRYVRLSLGFYPQEADFSDLVSAGREGLLEAALTYKPREDYPFVLHAWRHCRRLVSREGQRLFFSSHVAKRSEMPQETATEEV